MCMIWGESMEKKKKNLITSILFSLIITLFMVLVTSTNMLKSVENFTYDYVYEKENSYNDDIIIVAIDDTSLAQLGKYESWNRGYYAEVINTINKFNPAVIGVDVFFTGTSDSINDNLLVEAARNSNNIVFASEMKSETIINDDYTSEKVVTFSNPFDALYEVIGKDGTGFANTRADGDGYVRHATISSKYNNEVYPSFAEQVYKKYADYNDYDYKEYKPNKKYLVNYNGYPEQGYDVISFVDVYKNTNLYNDLFEDRIVLIGAYATGLQDDYFVPISHNVKMNGIEIHANIINNIEHNLFIKDANKAVQYIFNIIFFLAIIFVISRFGFLWSSITAFAFILFEFLFGLILYKANIYYPTTALCIILFIGYVVIVVYNYVRERMEKGAVIKTFKQYMAPQVVEAFMKDNKQSSNLIGERRDVACLFVDIRGFTRMSETLVDPVKVVKILNDYLGMTTKQIFDNDGMLDKFIGDACMAIFNAPFDIEDYEFKAIKAGLGIVKYGEPIVKQVFDDYGITIGFGVGVNCGEAIIGNIGCDFRKDYTGIGDTINTASRLESNAKAGQVIISEETLNRVKDGKYILKDRLIVEENGYLNLKGKAKPVLTYNVIGVKEEIVDKKEGENEEDTNDSKNQ